MNGAPMRPYVATPPDALAPLEIAPDVWWVHIPHDGNPDHINCYVLRDDDGWTVVDTGYDTPANRAVWQALLAGPFGDAALVRVLATHHHPDHLGLAGWLAEQHGARVITTRTAWFLARMLQRDAQENPPPEQAALWRAAGMDPAIFAERMAARPNNLADSTAPLPRSFVRIAEGDSIRLAGRLWHVHIGNGHAPEHATLWSEAGDLVIGGDQLLPSITPNLSVQAMEPEGDPLGEWLESCERLANYARDTQIVLPGHGLPYTGLPTRLRQMREKHHTALARLAAFLADPQSVADCLQVLFRRPNMVGAQYNLALGHAMAHVHYLYHRGRIDRRMGPDGAWLWQVKPGDDMGNEIV